MQPPPLSILSLWRPCQMCLVMTSDTHTGRRRQCMHAAYRTREVQAYSSIACIVFLVHEFNPSPDHSAASDHGGKATPHVSHQFGNQSLISVAHSPVTSS